MIVLVHKCRPKMKFPWLAWIIMVLQGMKPWKKDSFSHLSFSYTAITGNVKFCDATNKGGVKDMIAARFLGKYKIVGTTRLNLSKENPLGFQQWFEEHEGKKYSKIQLLGLLLKTLHIIKKNTWGFGTGRLTCNELIIDLIREYKKHPMRDSDDYDLNETMEIVDKYGY